MSCFLCKFLISCILLNNDYIEPENEKLLKLRKDAIAEQVTISYNSQDSWFKSIFHLCQHFLFYSIWYSLLQKKVERDQRRAKLKEKKKNEELNALIDAIKVNIWKISTIDSLQWVLVQVTWEKLLVFYTES